MLVEWLNKSKIYLNGLANQYIPLGWSKKVLCPIVHHTTRKKKDETFYTKIEKNRLKKIIRKVQKLK